MSLPILSDIISTISAFKMIDERDHLLIALSGGADSTALLTAMAEIAPRYDLRLSAAHVHHGLRGAEADRDAAFAERITGEIARRYGMDIPFHLHKADVKKIAKEKKLSTQEAGRLVRDTYLRSLMAEIGATKIATGHTGSDNAETFLMRLITGAGPEGLSGIPPVRLPYIRPLIETTRAEIEAFLTARDIPWIVDSSNLKSDYLRNRVRNEIMPALAAINPSIERSLMEAVSAYRDTFAPVKTTAEDFVAQYASGNTIPAGRLAALAPPVASEAVKLLIFAAATPRPTPLRLTRCHIQAVLSLAASPPHGTKTVKLPGGLVARRIYENLIIATAPPHPKADGTTPPETLLAIPGTTPLSPWGLVATARIIDAGRPGEGSDSPPSIALRLGADGRRQTAAPFEAQFDYDRINHPPVVRARRPGDRITMPGGTGSKKLSDLFIDAKVPADERNRVPLVASGADIIWVVGWAIDGRFAPSGRTRRVLSVTFERMDR